MASQFKFGRNYFLQVQNPNGGATVTIEPPFTLEFDINREYYSAANAASIRIYNLGAVTRDLLRHDQIDMGYHQSVILQVGYGELLSTVLIGTITQCWSVRQGNNYITEIIAHDLGFAFANAQLNMQNPAGTDFSTILKQMVGTLTSFGVQVGHISNTFSGTTNRGSSYVGSTTDILTDLTGGGFFVDNGVAHCLQDYECLPDAIYLINSDTGLLGTPLKENAFWKFDMILEPNLKLGQRVKIESNSQITNINQIYKVLSLHHRGTISEAVCGEVITTVGCQAGNYAVVRSV